MFLIGLLMKKLESHWSRPSQLNLYQLKNNVMKYKITHHHKRELILANLLFDSYSFSCLIFLSVTIFFLMCEPTWGWQTDQCSKPPYKHIHMHNKKGQNNQFSLTHIKQFSCTPYTQIPVHIKRETINSHTFTSDSSLILPTFTYPCITKGITSSILTHTRQTVLFHYD